MENRVTKLRITLMLGVKRKELVEHNQVVLVQNLHRGTELATYMEIKEDDTFMFSVLEANRKSP